MIIWFFGNRSQVTQPFLCLSFHSKMLYNNKSSPRIIWSSWLDDLYYIIVIIIFHLPEGFFLHLLLLPSLHLLSNRSFCYLFDWFDRQHLSCWRWKISRRIERRGMKKKGRDFVNDRLLYLKWQGIKIIFFSLSLHMSQLFYFFLMFVTYQNFLMERWGSNSSLPSIIHVQIKRFTSDAI